MDLRLCISAIALSVCLAVPSRASAQNATIEAPFVGLEISGAPGLVTEIAVWPNTGVVYVCGAFTQIYGAPFGSSWINVAKIDTNTGLFSPVISYSASGPTGGTSGSGFLGGEISSIAYWPSRNAMVIGGSFLNMDGTPAWNIACHTLGASAWQPIMGGVGPGHVNDLSVGSDNSLVVVGKFSSPYNCIVRANPNGTSWFPLGAGPSSLSALTSAEIDCVHAVTKDDIVVAGHGTNGSGGISYFVEAWNGTTWTILGMVGSWNIRKTKSGDVYIIGYDYSSITGQLCDIAKWNGTAWSAVGSISPFLGMDELLNGDMLFTVRFPLPTTAPLSNGLVRLDSNTSAPTWDAFSPLPSSGPGSTWAVKASGTYKETVYAGIPGGIVKMTPVFPAASGPLGTSCGPQLPPGQVPFDLVHMNATQPWLGSTFDTHCLFPAAMLPSTPVLFITDKLLSTPSPLSSYTPAPLGCSIYLDIASSFTFAIPLQNPSFGGLYPIRMQIPPAMGLVGANLYQQVLAYNPSGLSYSTRAWTMTLGGFGPW